MKNFTMQGDLNMDEKLLYILQKEVKPALGCTGPTSVSFAVSAAKDAVGGNVNFVKLIVDRDTYKNSVSVGIPGTSQEGVEIAAALGAICGNSKLGLEVLKNVKKEDEISAKKFVENNLKVEIDWNTKEIGLFIEAFVETSNGLGHAVVSQTHTNVVLIEVNNKIIYKKEKNENSSLVKTAENDENDEIRKYKIKDFYDFAKNVPINKLSFIKEAIDMNKLLAEAGLKKHLGADFGNTFMKLKGSTEYIKAKAYTAAASDARMSGENLSAMSCASSGNVGITASLPLLIISEENNKNEEELLRSVCLSFLLTIYIKSNIGRLSAMCACAIAAGVGVAAGSAYLLDGSYEKIELSIKNIVGSLGGVLCDGAKLGCALKLSTAVGVAIESAYLAINGGAIPSNNGIVCSNADETLIMLGKIAREGMIDTDRTICKAIIERRN